MPGSNIKYQVSKLFWFLEQFAIFCFEEPSFILARRRKKKCRRKKPHEQPTAFCWESLCNHFICAKITCSWKRLQRSVASYAG
jgi:hypothetical protein